VLSELTYEDVTHRLEFLVFSASERRCGIARYSDSRQVYGYIALGEGRHLHGPDDIERAA
jgi:hypothetical protein